MTATVAHDQITLQRVDRLGGLLVLVVTNPTNDYDGFTALPSALRYEGRTCGKSGYDSDRGYAYYRSDRPTAEIA